MSTDEANDAEASVPPAPAPDEDNNGAPVDTSNHDFIELKSIEDVKALEQKQLYMYIEKLHGIIRKYDNKLAIYKQKLKFFLTKESEIKPAKAKEQEKQPEENQEPQDETPKELSETDAFSFVDEMRQAAKHAENLNNFVYEPTSGMYYDPKTGYYYNAEYGLYYDGNTGCYYSYDHAKNSYEFHSQAQVQENNLDANGATNGQNADDDDADDIEVEFDEFGGVITDKAKLKQIRGEKQKLKERAAKSKRKAKKKSKKKAGKKSKKHKKEHRHHHKTKKRSKRNPDADAEDGELSESSSSSSSSSDSSSDSDGSSSESSSDVPVFKAGGRFQDIAKKYPPSLRLVVQETNLDSLKVGSLHLITFKGGSLGREGAHDVIIPDVNVSKCHLKFHYDSKPGIYKCRDMGSRNGTILNGTKMSSEQMDLVHGSYIVIGQTKLLCHVHEGNSTCGLCEPGLLIETPGPAEAATNAQMTVLSHKEQLKKLQKKYGLENEKFVESNGNGQQNSNYNDRAATRRIKVGSSTDKEKTEVACVNTEIASSNKGFKMLSKLGWQKGDTLGKTNASTGLLAPINVMGNEGTSGLGNSEPTTASMARSAPVDKRKLANLKITQARYQRAKDMFDDSD
ncbi:angiogenic factor with G patch and FHA domains 1 [Drosophila tropicalis]|uniref:angiogenic factor with G patch and FHA domains 1 n=1 Tax=Drosophila tropicalis TaxID=46794 RepID=UPI0035ABBA0D